MATNHNISLGLCCLNTVLREPPKKDGKKQEPVFTSRTCRLQTLYEKGVDYLKELGFKNIEDLKKMITWNKENGIHVFRMSSEMFPHISNPKLFLFDEEKGREYNSLEWAREKLAEVGQLAKSLGIRLTFHPGQFNQIGAKDDNVFIKTLVDLEWHARVLDMLGTDNPVMVIHGGGTYGNKEETIKRWQENYKKRVPELIKRFLVLENCEKCYSVEDLLPICVNCNIPMVYDTHHYSCYTILHPDEKQKPIEELIPAILETWKRRGIKPKFHISEQGAGRCGHHSDYIEVIPDHVIEIPEKYNMSIDLMVEAKMKEQAILRLYEKYGPNNFLKM